MSPQAYTVRFKGHLVTAIRSGLSRKPILLRRRKNEPQFEVPIEESVTTPADHPQPDWPAQYARLECARAIKRTEEARRRLQGDHLLRGSENVERLLRDYAMTRRGKRWKICKVEATPAAAENSQTHETKTR